MKKSEDPASDDDRAPLAVGYAWAARITGIGLEFVIPILIGVWLDRKLGTVIVFLFAGLLVGMGIGFVRLREIIKQGQKP